MLMRFNSIKLIRQWFNRSNISLSKNVLRCLFTNDIKRSTKVNKSSALSPCDVITDASARNQWNPATCHIRCLVGVNWIPTNICFLFRMGSVLANVTTAWFLLDYRQMSIVYCIMYNCIYILYHVSHLYTGLYAVSDIYLPRLKSNPNIWSSWRLSILNMQRFNLTSSGYGSYFLRMFASVWICTFPVASDRLFQVTLNLAGQGMCATDPPSLTLSLPPTSGPVCVPGNARCGWKCSMAPQCTNYNFKSADQCELFFFEPQGYNLVDGCTHYNYETVSNMVCQLICCQLIIISYSLIGNLLNTENRRDRRRRGQFDMKCKESLILKTKN